MSKYDETVSRYLSQAQAMTSIAMATNFSEIDKSSTFHFFDLPDDLINKARSLQSAH